MGWHRYTRAIIIRKGVILFRILVLPKWHIRSALVFWWLAIGGGWARGWSVDWQVGSPIIRWVVVCWVVILARLVGR